MECCRLSTGSSANRDIDLRRLSIDGFLPTTVKILRFLLTGANEFLWLTDFSVKNKMKLTKVTNRVIKI